MTLIYLSKNDTPTNMITIIDYKAGNLTSVVRAVNHLGFECRVTRNVEDILSAERVIFPGVGSAGQAMEDLKNTGLSQTIKDFYASGRPFLGICLGTQIILEKSEELNTTCLGLIRGEVKRFPEPLLSDTGERLKVPHMGWNRVELKRPHPVLKGISADSEFYFVHSYYPAPASDDIVIGTTSHGMTFTSILGHDNIIAAQFHPEKSGRPGLAILKNFCLWDGKDA
jgi:glutamine amidotransferase